MITAKTDLAPKKRKKSTMHYSYMVEQLQLSDDRLYATRAMHEISVSCVWRPEFTKFCDNGADRSLIKLINLVFISLYHVS